MELEVEISEDANYKSILKAEVCPINPIPSDPHRKTVDWFLYDVFPEQTIAITIKSSLTFNKTCNNT